MAFSVSYVYDIVDKYSAKLDKIRKNTKKMTVQATKGVNILNSAFAALGATMVAAKIKNELGNQVKAFQTWEDGWVGIVKNLNGTEKQFKSLEKTFKAQSKTSAIATQDYLAIGEAAAAAGYSIDNMASVVNEAMKLQTASNLTGAEAVDTIKILINATGEQQKNFGKLSSTIVALGQITTGGESQIAHYTKALTGFAASSGYAAPIVLAFGAALKDSGLEAASSGTALERMSMILTKSIDDKTYKLFAKVAGESAESFKKLIQAGDPEALLKFAAGLKNMSKELGMSRESLLEAFGIKDIRFARTIKVIGDNVDKVRTKIKTATKAYDENTAATEEYNKRSKTLTATLQRLDNRMLILKTTFAAGLVAVMKRSEPIIAKIYGWFEKLSPEMKNTIVIISVLSTGLLFMIPIVAGLAIATSALGIGLLPLAGIIGLVVTALGSWIYVGLVLKKHWHEIIEDLTILWDKWCTFIIDRTEHFIKEFKNIPKKMAAGFKETMFDVPVKFYSELLGLDKKVNSNKPTANTMNGNINVNVTGPGKATSATMNKSMPGNLGFNLAP